MDITFAQSSRPLETYRSLIICGLYLHFGMVLIMIHILVFLIHELLHELLNISSLHLYIAVVYYILRNPSL